MNPLRLALIAASPFYLRKKMRREGLAVVPVFFD